MTVVVSILDIESGIMPAFYLSNSDRRKEIKIIQDGESVGEAMCNNHDS